MPTIIQGRRFEESDLADVCALLKAHPEFSRRRLSVELATMWKWRTATGQIKHFAAYSLLRKLEQRGWIGLPALRRVPQRRGPIALPLELFERSVPEAIEGALSTLLPLRIMVLTSKTTPPVHRYLALHHYLGYRGPVGENLAYQIQDRAERDLACVVFGAAAWKTQARDQWIGWNPEERVRGIQRIANNSRFLILPWVRVPHLASHVLGLILRRLASDWQAKYAHPIHLAETFVDRSRFRGTCYRAANWICIGQTQGRSRQDRRHTLNVPVKDIYVYPLRPDFRERLIRE
jgi:hypothetical protein